MQLSNLLTDDDAVSPVIGVILMVAITVILAAVIGGVVTSLGQEKTSSTPTASFAFDTVNSGGDGDAAADELRITHDGGDNLDPANLVVKVDSASPLSNEPTNTISAGDSWIAADDVTDSTIVKVVWNNPDSDSSTTLGTFEG